MEPDNLIIPLNYFYITEDGEKIPIDSIQDLSIDSSIAESSLPEALIKNESIELKISQKDANKFWAALFNTTNRIIHLSKYGKTKRIRKKNYKRIYTNQAR